MERLQTVALPVEYFHPMTVAIQEDEEYRVEHCDFDIQLELRRQAVDGLSKVQRFGVEVNFFNFSVGSHHE